VFVQADAEDVDFFADEEGFLEAAAVAVERVAGALPAVLLEVSGGVHGQCSLGMGECLLFVVWC
jgi:hypothetical protein